MEYLDIYEENGNYIGKEERRVVHEKGLWHKTVHCWFYDSEGNVYFQIRKDGKKLYTTVSGHVSSGETIKDAFDREISEELGINPNKLNMEQIETVYFRMDKEKNGEKYIDRAFANIFICLVSLNINELNFVINEVDGLAKVNAKEAFDLLRLEKGTINGTLIKNENNKMIEIKKEFFFDDFLINKGERGISKYGFILERIMSKIKM